MATLAMDVQEDGGLRPGYELKLNSYDLGVDIELADAIQRLRFEHPEVGAVVLTSLKERVFCAGANIRMLSQSGHGWKVNFCKFTNETRNAMEEASAFVRPALPHRRERALRRRRLRAGAGDRLDRDGGRRQHRGVASRGAAPRGAARHRRAHAPDRQASRPAGPGGRLLHARGRDQGPAGGGVGPGRRGRLAVPARRGRPGPRGASSRSGATGPRRRGESRCRRSTGRSRGTGSRTATSPARSIGPGAWRRSPWRRRPPPRRATWPGSTRRAPPSGRSRSRGSWTT